ncbi:MAG: TrmH family RNA methyltransferase, partial [Bryobacteraceae bacterium]
MAKLDVLTSAANPLLKDIHRAIVRGGLTSGGLWVAETFHLLEEALRSDREVSTVLAARSVEAAVRRHVRRLAGVRIAVLDDELMQKLSGVESSPGVIALVQPPAWTLESLFRGCGLVVAIDGVQDPGNAGAIVRSAEAFGATGVLFLKGSAGPHHPSSLRASAGSLFRVPFVASADRALARAAFRQNKLDVYAAAPSG